MDPKRVTAAAFSLVCAVLFSASGVSAQPVSRFEVASVKPNTSGDFEHVDLSVRPGGRFTAVNVALQELVQLAYGISDFQVVDAPDWIRGARFDVDAEAPSELTPGTAPPQLRQLLIDRFHLAAHRDTREMPIYHLVLARSDRRLGPSLNRAETDGCAEARRERSPSAPPAGRRPRCLFRVGTGSLIAASMSMATLASRLKALVGRIVDDETGLDGLYDFEMKWLPPGGASTTDPGAPSIFTALQEQLGLKLEAARAPVDVLVIDHIERPEPD